MNKLGQFVALMIMVSLLLVLPRNCFAGIETNQQTLSGPFASGATYITQDGKFTDPNWSTYLTSAIQSTVSMKVLDNVLISSSFTYTVNLQLQYYTAPGSAVSTVNTSLTVNYVPGQGAKYKGLDSYNLTTAYSVTVTVTGSSTTGTVPAGAVQLNTSIVIDRSYPFVATTGVAATYTVANNTKQLQVSWSSIPSADEYDVEWTTINDGNSNFAEISANAGEASSPGDPVLNAALAQAFINNASRTTTQGNSVSLSMLSTDSIMLVRVRQVQYNKTSGVRIAGNWDYTNGSAYAIWLLNWDEPNQNWQYSAAFAESGKKKEVISYFDGTLRGRQTVTLNNSDNVAIAQENIYDDFGRPTASILPAAYKEPTLVPYLHYIPNFNLNAAGLPYNSANVTGTVPALCEPDPDSLNTTAGASRYYSAQNDFKSLNIGNNYIPDAAGFPLSVTQYTGDNTGRIKAQGGVGLAFQPGKSGSPLLSKTTKYYYGKPEQWELDQLFASDAGYAEHYLKNMVVDPNGQISISYLNASGKTVATALTGQAPAMLDTLPSYHSVHSTSPPQNIHILKPSQFTYDSDALTLAATTTYLASVVGTDTLKFNIPRLIDKYPGTFHICSNCYYKMTAVVSDDCGNIAASITTPVKIGDTINTCADTSLYNGTLVVPVNEIGEYNVNLQFAFDNNIIQAYADTFINKGLDSGYIQQQFDYIKQRYLDSLNVTGCFADCHTCNVLLGAQSAFVQMLVTKCTALGLDSASVAGASFNTWASGLYTSLKDSCNALQATCSYSPCADAQSQMQDDVSPGGQYALFDASGNSLEPEINVLTETIPGASSPNWRVIFPVLPSTNAIYIRNEITLPDSSITSPNDVSFTIQNLITYWQPSWATYFLPYHPEYCQLQFCQSMSSYENWDLRVQEDFTKASDVPSIPTGGAPLSYSYTNASDWLLSADPFFKTGAPGNTYLSQMDNALLNYSTTVLNNTGAPLKGLMAYDDYALYCQDASGNTNTATPNNNWTDCVPNVACRVADKEWALYSQYYFQLKQTYYNLLQAASCGSICPVGQPVVSNLPGSCPAIGEFNVQLYTGASACTGSQTAVVVHTPGTLSQLMTIELYYPSVYSARTDLTRSVVLSSSTSQQTFCVPDDVPVSCIKVSAVYCGSPPSYGNDPTYVVHLTDGDGGDFPACPGGSLYNPRITTLSLEDSHGNPVTATSTITVTVTYNVTDCLGSMFPTPTLIYIAPTHSTGSYLYGSPGSCNAGCEGPQTTVLSCVSALTNVSNITGISACSGGITVNNPQPPASTCPAAYAIKIPRFLNIPIPTSGEETGITDSSQLTVPGRQAVQVQAADMCNGNAASWISQLQPGLTAMGATPTQVNNLTAAFIEICSESGDVAHPMGASTLPPGETTPYVSFGAAIQSILLGGGNFTSLLNPWLIDNPYPYSPLQQSSAKNITISNSQICSLLQNINTQAAAAGKTPYNYMVSTYGSAMTLSQADLDTLQNSCSSCKFILAGIITLPVFLDPDATGCVLRSAYVTAKANMNAAFGGTLSTTDPNYQTILSNYMNQQWGFSLTYYDYAAFDTSSAPLLCNSLPYSSVNADPYDCVENAVGQAISNGLADYANYLVVQRQKFIASYTNTCSMAQANANLTAVQQEYHYTLYYYDQADNLVRTIPPEGITLVNQGLFNYIDKARDLDTAAYPYTYNGPDTASNLTTAMTTLSTVLSAATGSVEMWLYNNGQNNYHWVEVTPDTRYLFQVGLAANQLNIDVFPLTTATAAGVQLVPSSLRYQVNISAQQPLLPFTHIVFQGNNLGAGTSLPEIFVNGTELAVTTSVAITQPYGFTITAGSSSVTYPDSIESLKHLRLYNHLLNNTVISEDAASQFFNAYDLTYLGWYRFNVPAPGAPPTTINSTTSNETAIFDIYPAHVLPTTYAYNATNQVTEQLSPDGGTNRYWYDLLSRLVISENDKQLPLNNYSYTTYDALGRITEVGQKNYTGTTIGSPDYLTSAVITAFNAAGTNSQITDTYYDSPVPTVAGNANGIATLPGQSNLRKRVAASTYTETQGSPALRATYYNYDIDGNVQTLWQQVDGLYQNSANTGLKRIDYEYDLVSGKVNFVRYQDGQPDEFYYAYNYDADNRLTAAMSGTTAMVDTLIGSHLLPPGSKQDADYYYYLHGPLRRMELGDASSKVQGIDYAYTLQGWLKGVNSATGTAAADIGQDGNPVARDAYGYSIGYYSNDYKPIGGSAYNAFALKYTSNTGDITGQSLYNGNISNTTLAINQLGNPVGYTYHYDQLNRLKKMRQHIGISGTNWDRTSITLNYHENATYDGNGNILTYGRNGAAPTAQTIDSLTYNYGRTSSGRLTSNKLNSINDAIANSNYTGDLTNQTDPANYRYDAIGNLIYDTQSGITGNDGVNAITWSVYGKIQSIYKITGTITYTYNPAGERVSKTVGGNTTWYIRDAQGNPLALYNNIHGTTNWQEQDLYGSSRLGMWQPNVTLTANNAIAVWDTTANKQFELPNYLGNVLETITDKRIQHSTDGVNIDYYNADVSTAQDFYPYGMLMPYRQYSFSNVYRYGFNGKENDNEVKGLGNQIDYGKRIYDPRVGRFLSIDPYGKSFPSLTPYQFAANKPINSIDLEGAEYWEIIHWLANTGTSKQTAQLVAPYAQSILHINEKQTMFAFGIENGLASGFDAIGLSEQYKKYANEALQQLLSARMNTFMQEDMSFDKLKKLFPEFRMSEDAVMGIRAAIDEAYSGDPYAAGQVFGMCLTAGFGGIEGTADAAAALRGLGGRGVEAAEILEGKVPKPELNGVKNNEPTIQKVNGRNPRNYQFAGKTYKFEAGSALDKEYPNGVDFDKKGFPDFSPYATKTVDIGKLNKNPQTDVLMANKLANLTVTPDGYTWHHVENSTTMQLIPTDLNQAVAHTGGRATNGP